MQVLCGPERLQCTSNPRVPSRGLRPRLPRDATHYFRTLPAKGARGYTYRLWGLGDAGAGTLEQARVLEAMHALSKAEGRPADAVLALGGEGLCTTLSWPTRAHRSALVALGTRRVDWVTVSLPKK